MNEKNEWFDVDKEARAFVVCKINYMIGRYLTVADYFDESGKEARAAMVRSSAEAMKAAADLLDPEGVLKSSDISFDRREYMKQI